MIVRLADHIITPLGDGVESNLAALRCGESRLAVHHDVHGESVAEPFVGSLFDHLPERHGFTPFEALCIAVAEPAVRRARVDVSADDCVFIISTTKGNIWSSPADSARKVAAFFGNNTPPVVVSNACTSGVSAQLTAFRLLSSGRYKTAVLIGCDVQNRFIVSGFQAFKALSATPCKPFDAARNGLNAGEAAAALILTRTDRPATSIEPPTSAMSPSSIEPSSGMWTLLGGGIHNDANHISGPSRTAEGSWRCLRDTLALLRPDEVACVSVHGTATLYNDEMEALALHRAGLGDIPVSGLKGSYGHTMGAAGLLETILTLHALDRGIVLPTRGFTEQGTTNAVNVSPEERSTDERAFIKLLSGFGGVNAAVAWRKGKGTEKGTEECIEKAVDAPISSDVRHTAEQTDYEVLHEVRIDGPTDLVARYRIVAGDYPKFFKMDTLCRLGFVATEELLHSFAERIDPERTVLILANHSASLQNDLDYQTTIAEPANYYPSPALFVYTLPNIVTGELAIRHHLFGETTFYILEKESDLAPLVAATLTATSCPSAIVGWVECSSRTEFSAHLQLLVRR